MSAYYAGGALGCYFPGYLYQKIGWTPFIIFLTMLLGGLTWLSLALRHAAGAATQEPE